MDYSQMVSRLSLKDKTHLASGVGSWHTYKCAHLPAIMMTDGPHGLRKQDDKNKGINDSNKATCFPTACAVATSWNTANAALIADAIAKEAIAEDVSVVLGPGLNIKRSPLCGRNFEYFSEDPLLAGHMATSYVNAMQANGVGSCVKHFAVNSQETRRMTIDAIVDERALREIYLSAFERVIKNAQPYCVMTGYNKINGLSCAQNPHLLTEILRQEWGFEGLVMSDWGACYNVDKALNAGLDLEMPEGGSYHRAQLEKYVQNGTVAESQLDTACTRVANLVAKCSVEKQRDVVDLQRHNDICRQVAADSAVLLKNQDGILPLNKDSKVLVVGELAEKPRYQGAGSSHINATADNFLTVLQANGIQYTYCKGYNVRGDKVSAKLEKQALKLASQFDTILFFGGLTDDFEGEGYDRTKLDIPTCQQQLLAKLAQVNGNIVFVAFGGSPMSMPWLDNAKALLNMYLGGQAVMHAAYDLLFGNVCPSGRLAESYPLNLEDTPCYHYFANNYFLDEHRESIFVGYRYYNTFNIPVLFPFGYGLSYTEFTYSDMQLVKGEDGVDVLVTVTNTGNASGSEVVQVYVDNCNCGIMRPARQLAGFTKVYLPQGESVRVSVHVEDRAFSVWYNNKMTMVQGEYTVSVCSNVNCPLISAKINVLGEEIPEQGYSAQDYMHACLGGATVEEEKFYALVGKDKPLYYPAKRGTFTLNNTLGDMECSVGFVRFFKKIVAFVAKRMSPSKSSDDPVARMVVSGSMETPLISMMSVAKIPPRFVMFLLYHANKQHGKAFKALFGKYDILI